ncbi:RNA-guided endonuclease InsQ/TnpB family protein [Methanothrix soehngenii]|uniref:RNA-guided endonuclease InsQ/TnpB family protein n=3 Tax=Methanothrix soehngenii TaxID=2223 RepID=UPI002FE3272D
MKTAYKFRMYPNRLQEAQLDLTLETCRHLYNTALADRKNAYETEGISRSYEDQAAMLTVERENGNFLGIYAHCLQDVLRRLDKSFKAFFRRVKAGENPGYPRFKGRGWYKSFTYPDSETGYKMEGSKLTLSKIGTIRIFKHREVEGKIKTCTIKKDLLGHWYAVLVAEIEDAPAVEPTTTAGVDVGLKSLITTSAGESIQYPRNYIQLEEKLAAAQRSLSRKKRGSANRLKAKAKVAKISKRIQNLRDEFLHQVSRKLVDSADIIVFENLNINGMLKNHHLAKHIQDHAWGKLIQFTQGKAAKAGKVVELVDARCTSQKCSQCGIMVPKTLADRVHLCPKCGLEMDRDLNASINIRTLGLRGRAYRDAANNQPVSDVGSPGI